MAPLFQNHRVYPQSLHFGAKLVQLRLESFRSHMSFRRKYDELQVEKTMNM